jgi:hypothetical protein
VTRRLRPFSETAAEAEQMRALDPAMTWAAIARALGITYRGLAYARRHVGAPRPARPRGSRQFDLVDTEEL